MNVKDTVSTANPASDYHLRKAGKHGPHATLDNIQKDKTESIEIPKDSVEISKDARDMAEAAKLAEKYPYIMERLWRKQPLEDNMERVHREAQMAWSRSENDELLEIYKEEFRNKKKKDDQTKEAGENNDKTKENIYGQWKFNMDAFQGHIRDTLIKSINSKDTPVENFTPTIVSEAAEVQKESNVEIEAAEIPEENDVEMSDVENLAQRLVDMAMKMDMDYDVDPDGNWYVFQRLPELSDEEYIELVRDGIEQGYKGIKNDLQYRVGSLSEASSKFLDDVYKLAMKKFDDLLEQVRNGEPLKSRDVDLANQRLLNTGNISSGNA